MGTNLNVVVTFSTDPLPILQGGTAGATSFTGAEQVLPNPANFVGADATTGPATVDVTSAAGELVFAVVGCETCNSLTPVLVNELWIDVNPLAPAYYGAWKKPAGWPEPRRSPRKWIGPLVGGLIILTIISLFVAFPSVVAVLLGLLTGITSLIAGLK